MLFPFSFWGGLDPVTIAWLQRLQALSMALPSSSFISSLDKMVRKMRADGNLLIIDRLFIFATEIQGHATVSIVNPTSAQALEVNTPTWTANQGYTGNGTNSYINTNVDMSALVHRTRNSGSYFYYKRTNAATVGFDCGWNNASSQGDVFRPNAAGLKAVSCNSVQGSSTVTVGNNGLFAAQRYNGTNYDVYRNGTNHETRANASIVLPATKFYVMCRNNNGTAANFSTHQFSMCGFGGELDQASFYSAFQTFATERGFNV